MLRIATISGWGYFRSHPYFPSLKTGRKSRVAMGLGVAGFEAGKIRVANSASF
jgi:hypothetical protein